MTRRVGLTAIAGAVAIVCATAMPAAADGTVNLHNGNGGGSFTGRAKVPTAPSNPGGPSRGDSGSGVGYSGGSDSGGGYSAGGSGGGSSGYVGGGGGSTGGGGGTAPQGPPPAVHVLPPGSTNPCVAVKAGPCGFISGAAPQPKPKPKPTKPKPGNPNQPGPPPPPKVSPAQALQEVMAQLKFVAPTPGFGPDHEANHLSDSQTGEPIDSAVGFPTWYWGVGGTRSESVSKSLAGMTVALSIAPQSLVINPGDGQTITCAGMGTPWSKDVPPGTRSPSACDHKYQKVGRYNVVATTTWIIRYNVNDGQGTVLAGDTAVQASQHRNINIGELQSVITQN